MKLKHCLPVAALLALGAAAASAQSYVTNWIAAPATWRVISHRIQDINTAPGWQTVLIPPGAFCHFSPVLPAPGQRGHFHAGLHLSSGCPVGISILNFPYQPALFTAHPLLPSPTSLTPARPIALRVFFLNSKTNWIAGGKPGSIQLNYDFGLPVTNLVPTIARSTAR